MAIRTAIAVPSLSTMKTEMLQHTHVGRTNRLWNHTESKPKNTGLILCHLLDGNSDWPDIRLVLAHCIDDMNLKSCSFFSFLTIIRV